MKPYGVTQHIGPACEWGCCFVQTPKTSPRRAHRHGWRPALKKRARQTAQREIRTAIAEAS